MSSFADATPRADVGGAELVTGPLVEPAHEREGREALEEAPRACARHAARVGLVGVPTFGETREQPPDPGAAREGFVPRNGSGEVRERAGPTHAGAPRVELDAQNGAVVDEVADSALVAHAPRGVEAGETSAPHADKRKSAIGAKTRSCAPLQRNRSA